jgi:predicted transposase YdaD
MVPTPHDALFKATFSDLARAAEEIRHVFAPEIVARMDLSTLALEPGSAVDGRLRQCHADMLYSVTFAGQRALVYVLLEHESSHDPWLPLWLLVYMTRIWESLLQREELARGGCRRSCRRSCITGRRAGRLRRGSRR